MELKTFIDVIKKSVNDKVMMGNTLGVKNRIFIKFFLSKVNIWKKDLEKDISHFEIAQLIYDSFEEFRTSEDKQIVKEMELFKRMTGFTENYKFPPLDDISTYDFSGYITTKRDILEAFTNCFTWIRDDEKRSEAKECIKEIEQLFDSQWWTLRYAYRKFVNQVWKKGYHDYISEKLKHDDNVKLKIGKTVVWVYETYAPMLIFSHTKVKDTLSERQQNGFSFRITQEISEDPNGLGFLIQNCRVPLAQALYLLEEAITNWPKAYKKLINKK